MENASKALIIAGAILLSILIIALGVYIYNQAQSTTKKVDMGSQAAQAHNADFLNYEGSSVSGSDVKALIDNVRTNNLKSESAASGGGSTTDFAKITIQSTATGLSPTTATASNDLSDLKNSVNISKQYKITISEFYKSDAGQNAGFVKTIKIDNV